MSATCSDIHPLELYGIRILEDYHASLLQQLPSPVQDDPTLRFLPLLKIGILGAGVCGLYTALILDSLGIEYEILEASDRVGGRLSTFNFPNGGEYDYYEEGAMRFPLPKKDTSGKYKNGVMKRLAELTEYEPLNQGPDPLKEQLIPYYVVARKGSDSKPGFYYFNRVCEDVPEPGKRRGDFDARGMNVDDAYIRAGVDAIVSDVIDPFAKGIMNDILTGQRKGWEKLMEYDSLSVRAYMAAKYLPSDHLKLPRAPLPISVVNWCELFGDSTGPYDQALTEAVLESLAFAPVGGSDFSDVDWMCFKGGSETLSKKMKECICGSIQVGKRVTTIKEDRMIVSLPEKFDTPPWVDRITSKDSSIVIPPINPPRRRVILPCVTVTVNGTETRKYSHVISTLPLPVLRTIDLSNAGLNVMQRNALRTLSYGPSVKIAILFQSPWWTTAKGLRIFGGQSFTDLPIRNIIYPSYGADSTPSNVIIASYSWTCDAERLSALASMKNKDILRDLVLRDLAEAHKQRDATITYGYLKQQFVSMSVKDWSSDEHAMGAFALFQPGQFGDLYKSLNFPAAKKRLHFASEVLSTRHSWVVGALDSAWRAVLEYLKVTGQSEKEKEFKRIWGENVEWVRRSAVDPNQELRRDILDMHLELVDKAVLGGVIPHGKPLL